MAAAIGGTIYNKVNQEAPITHCQLCGNHLGSQARNIYTASVQGQSRRVCSHCYQNLQRQNSRAAVRNLQSDVARPAQDSSQAGHITRG